MNAGAHALPPGVGERVDALLAAGNREAALETVMREVVLLSEKELTAFRAMPAWQARRAAVHTLTREVRGIADGVFDPEQGAKITVPTLLLTGENSPDPAKLDIETVAAALPDARIIVLEGQQHVADVLVPEVFAKHVVAFLRDQQ